MLFVDDGLDGEYDAAPAPAITEDDAFATIMAEVAQGVPQPQRDNVKMKFLASYATEDCGCKTAEDVVALFAKLDSSNGYGAPHTLVDRLYSSAQLARSVAAFEASKLA